MTSITKNDNAFTGLEAAIVLIAFVVVAAVFSYVVLGAGFFTTQKSQETVYTGVAQATSNIQMIGQVYGLTSSTTTVGNIQEIRFSIGLAPGSPTLDISKMKIVFSTPGTVPVIYTAATTGSETPAYAAGAPVFIARENGAGDAQTALTSQQQQQISFKVPSNGVAKNTVMNMELRPSVGASLPFTKTAPPAITYMNVLF
jgi:flagellin FlaB